MADVVAAAVEPTTCVEPWRCHLTITATNDCTTVADYSDASGNRIADPDTPALLALPDGTLIAGTQQGVVWMPDPVGNPGVGVECLQAITVFDLAFDAATSAVYAGTDGDFIIRWDPVFDQCDTTAIDNTNSPLLGNDDKVRAVLADSTGVWFGTELPSLMHLDTATGTWIIHRPQGSPLVFGTRINDLALEHQMLGSPATDHEIVWVALDGRNDIDPSVLRRDEVLPAWTRYSVIPDGIPDRRVQGVAVDTNGLKWLSTRGGIGVYPWP